MNTHNACDDDVRAIMRSMTTEEKIGQLFVMAFPGKNPAVVDAMIEKHGIGGCYISQENIETFEEAKRLSTSLQKTARGRNPGLPLMLGVDQEGAWGVLIPESVIGPGNLALGLSDDTTHTSAMYGIFAQEMCAVGYQTLAPCADINLDPQNPIIGTRSFGEDPQRVARHVRAAVTALKQHGAIATAKHFPGHGDTHSDTHRGIPVVDKAVDVLQCNELLPFQAAIDAGVDIIMTSHILYTSIDPEQPATLSAAVLTDLLRDKMDFKGVVITDSMNMGAMRKHYSPEDATIRALHAGTDMIMLSEEHYDHSADYLQNQEASIAAVAQALAGGTLSERQLDEKIARIIALKLKIAGSMHASRSALSQQQMRRTEQAAAAAAVKIISNTNKMLPLKTENIALINATPMASYHNLMNPRGIGPNQAEPAFAAFADMFCKTKKSTEIFPHEKIARAPECLNKFDVLIAVTEDHPLPGEDFDKGAQITLVQNLIKAYNHKLVVVGLRSPYDYRFSFPDAGGYVCAHSGRTCSAREAARLMAAGELN